MRNMITSRQGNIPFLAVVGATPTVKREGALCGVGGLAAYTTEYEILNIAFAL